MATTNNNDIIPFEFGILKIQIPKNHYRWTIIIIAAVILISFLIFGILAFKYPIPAAGASALGLTAKAVGKFIKSRSP